MTLPSVGSSLSVKGEPGVVKFVGKTKFSPGTWIGIELDASIGKNDGSVNGIRYFDCEKSDQNYGIFVRPAFLGLPDPTPISSPILHNASTNISDLHRVIDKLQFKLKNTTEDIKEYKQTVDQLKDELTQKQMLASKLESNFEMVSIDKDYLNEQNSQLQQDLKNLNDKYNDLKKDYDLVHEELELNKQLEEAIKSQVNDENKENSNIENISKQDFQLIVSRNKQLESALSNLNQLTNENKKNFEDQLNALKLENGLNNDKLNNYDQLLSNFEAAQLTINSLQTQLDSALELEKIIEHLTSKNEQLQNQIKSLNDTVNELNEIHELDKSLEESQSQIEINLRNDIKSLLDVIQNDKLLISDLERKNKYLESKVSEYKVSASSQSDRNSTFSSDYHEVMLDELNLQLDSLKLQIKKYKSSSTNDKISLKVAQTKLDLLQQFDSSLISTNLNLKRGYEVLFNINLNVAYTSIMLDSLENLNSSEIEYQLSNLSNIKLHLKLLFSFLQSIAHLWEYNYATKHYVNNIISFKEILSLLNQNLMISINHVKEGDVDNVPVSYLKSFIQDCHDLLKLNFVNDTYSIIFQNLSLFKISALSVAHESSEEITLTRYILNYLDRHFQQPYEPDELIQEIYDKIQLIFELSTDITEDAKSLLIDLNDASDASKDLTISDTKILSIDDICNPFNSLSRIVKKLEFEDFSIHDDDTSVVDVDLYKDIFEFDHDVESWCTLDSILEDLTKNRNLLKTKHEVYSKQAQSIYDAVNDMSSHSPPPDDGKELKHKRSIELKYSDLTNKLMEKDSRIQDLQLNVKLLEKNMASTDAKSKEYIEKLKNEMSVLKKDHENMKKNYDSLLKSNKELELEIQEILKSNQVFETSHLVGKFENMQAEKKFTDEMALIEEVLLLRKMVNIKYNQFTDHSQNDPENDDLEWLDQQILPNVGSPPPSAATSPNPNQTNEKSKDFRNSASMIRSIVNESQPVQVPARAGVWRPKVNIPRYVNALMEEKKKQYQHERNNSITSSFN